MINPLSISKCALDGSFSDFCLLFIAPPQTHRTAQQPALGAWGVSSACAVSRSRAGCRAVPFTFYTGINVSLPPAKYAFVEMRFCLCVHIPQVTLSSLVLAHIILMRDYSTHNSLILKKHLLAYTCLLYLRSYISDQSPELALCTTAS